MGRTKFCLVLGVDLGLRGADGHLFFFLPGGGGGVVGNITDTCFSFGIYEKRRMTKSREEEVGMS